MSSQDSAKEGFVFVAILIGIPILWDYLSQTRIYHSLLHSVDFGSVTVDRKPPDCDFMFAPIGRKGCDYKAQAVTTSDWTRPGETTGLHVSWNRVAD
jgi:hypothetical protein